MTCLRPLMCRMLALLMVLAAAAGPVASHDIDRAPTFRPQDKEKSKEETKEKEQKDQPKKKAHGLPLEPDRTIEFTTDEGTWLSLDVSPDGKTIVFELLGDLYTLPIAGGEAKAITSGMAFDSQPSYSPDGKTIAFVSDRDGADNLWIAGAGGPAPRPLTKDKQVLFASPSWTPDGEYVLVSRQPQLPWGAFEVWMYHTRGGSGVQVTKGKLKPGFDRDDYVHAIGAVASKDGKHLPTSALTTRPGPTAARRSPGPLAPVSSACRSIRSFSPR